MRSVFAPVVLVAFLAACSSSTTESTPQFTLADVKPSIEGTWKGQLTQAGVATPSTLVVTYAAPIQTQCSNRTLNHPGEELSTACADLTNVNLSAVLTMASATTSLTGSLSIYELTYKNSGGVSLQNTATNRLNLQLNSDKLVGTATLATGTYDVALAR